MSDLTAERLRELLDYDAEAGVFRWRARPYRSNIQPGQVAGTVYKNGYHYIQIDGFAHRSHRLAWLYVHGEFPPDYVDHINGKKADNRISNLRLCDNSQNQANRPAPKNNTSGVRGVRWKKSHKKWEANIWVGGQSRFLGRFAEKADAAAAYEAAAKAAFGDFVHNPEAR